MPRNVYANDTLHLPDEQPVTAAFLPFYHVYGLIAVMMRALASKHKLVVLPRFQPELLLSCIEKYKVPTLTLSIAYPCSTLLLANRHLCDAFGPIEGAPRQRNNFET